MKFEYVFSGLNMSRIHYGPFIAMPENVQATQSSLDEVNQNPDYHVGAMYNAFYEANRAEAMGTLYRKHFSTIHSDSGGLQIITRGMSITPELKLQVYECQGLHSDVAMCFDEIPLHVDENSNESKRTSMNGKIFVVPEMEDAARRTGENINEQLKTFARMNSPTKVMMIIQGNNRFDMARWGEIAYNAVDDDLKSSIYGIALADTCIGNGVLETVEMCAAVPMMNIPESIKRNIHLLGVGSIARLIPIIELSRTDLFKDCNISFDSSSHSQAMVKGKYLTESGKGKDFGRVANRENLKFLKIVFDEISKHHKHSVSFDDYAKFVTANLNTTAHLNDDNDRELVILGNLTFWFVPLICARRFMDNVVKCQKDPMHYYKILNKQTLRTIRPLLELANIKSSADFDVWFRQYSRYVDSNRIERVEVMLEDHVVHTLF